MQEFLSTWYGLTLFIVFDVVAAIAIIAIGYRWIFKRVFDVLLSALCLLVTSPLFLWVYVKYRAYKKADGEIETFLRRTPCVGKKGETVWTTSFNTLDKSGALAGEYGEGLDERKIKNLPRLLDVFFGRASLVGVTPLSFQDAAFLDDEQELRYSARVGLISPLQEEDKKSAEGWLAAESRYAQTYSLGKDLLVLLSFLLSKIRGERGEQANLSYAQSLFESEKITEEEYKSVLESAEEERQDFYKNKE